jgi:Zn-dependent protease
MNELDLLQRIMWLIPLVLSLSVHEWAHAYSAFKLGDDTAAREGRMTLNPVSHIDPIGTILVPLLSGIPFGWAKPVPIQPSRFSRNVRMSTGTIISSAAGPFSNLVLVVVCVLVLGLLARFAPELAARKGVSELIVRGIQVNVVLAIFNMLPVPPLDGSRVADGLMPYRFRPAWERFVAVGPAVLLLIIVMPWLLDFSLLSWPIAQAQGLAFAALRGIVTL